MGSVFAAVQNAASELRPSVPLLGVKVDGNLVTFLHDHEEIDRPRRAKRGRDKNGCTLKAVRLLTEMASANLHLVHGLQLSPYVCGKS